MNDLLQQLFHSCLCSCAAGVYLIGLLASAVTKLTLAFRSVEAGRVETPCFLVLIEDSITLFFYLSNLGDAILLLCASALCTPSTTVASQQSSEERL